MKTIEEKNRMIAEFMGYKFDIDNKCEIVEDFDIVENIQTYEADGGIRIVEGGYVITRFLPEQMRYHTSWDWLMPVIKEISNKTGYVYVMYGTDSYFTNMGDSFYFGGGFESIEETHIAVVQFIEWYNQNK